MKKIVLSLLTILLGILAFGLTLYFIQFIFRDVIKIHDIYNLKWISILFYFIGFFVSGLVTRKISLKYIPLLTIQFYPFYRLDKLYFPFYLIIILFSLFGLFIARKELKRTYKFITLFFTFTILIGYLFSQPLIIKKEYFHIYQGDYFNAKLIWGSIEGTKTLPPLNLYDKENKKISLPKTLTKKTVITFWATWCSSCLLEKPQLEKIKKEFKNSKDILFIDVSLDRNNKRWINYLIKNTPQGLQIISKNRGEDKTSLNITGIPFRILVNNKGDYKTCRDLATMRSLIQQNDSIYNAFIYRKPEFKKYVPAEKEKEYYKSINY